MTYRPFRIRHLLVAALLLAAGCRAGAPEPGEPTPPPAVEVCNGQDDDGNGVVDDGDGAADPVFLDSDSDGFSPCAGDCDDGLVEVFSGAPELCDGRDSDCDGVSELDGDSDGAFDCQDCAPTDPLRADTLPEVEGSGIDENCNGWVDEGECLDPFGPSVLSRGSFTLSPPPLAPQLIAPGPRGDGDIVLGGLDGLRHYVPAGDGSLSQAAFIDVCCRTAGPWGSLPGLVGRWVRDEGPPIYLVGEYAGGGDPEWYQGSDLGLVWFDGEGWRQLWLREALASQLDTTELRPFGTVGRPLGPDGPAMLLVATATTLHWLDLDVLSDDPAVARFFVLDLPAPPMQRGDTRPHRIYDAQGSCDVDGDGRSDAIVLADGGCPETGEEICVSVVDDDADGYPVQGAG